MVYLKFQILPAEQNVILIKNRLFNKAKEDNTARKDTKMSSFTIFFEEIKKKVPDTNRKRSTEVR
jgi:hypothetical protein